MLDVSPKRSSPWDVKHETTPHWYLPWDVGHEATLVFTVGRWM